MLDAMIDGEEAAGPLLGPQDPPAVEVFNASGRAPVLLLCDHASRAVPRALQGLGLEDRALHRHIAWDIGAADMARILARRFDAPLVLAGYSRLVVDCNRDIGDPTFIVEVSEDTVIPGNRDLTQAAVDARVAACYAPYHQAVDDRLAGFTAQGMSPAVISVHSFTPVFKGFERPWHVGILWQRDPRLAVPLMDGLRAHEHIVVGDNKPYSARDEFGYSIEAHGSARGLPQVLIEVRQDLLKGHDGIEAWALVLAEALAPVLDDPGLYQVEYYTDRS
jgi:predicted N-formylglutamate amidohydrolase